MACNHEYEQVMHKHFDKETTYEEETTLKHHLMKCEDCIQHYRELSSVQTLLTEAPAISQQASLKDAILEQLPKESKPKKFMKAVKEHPFITACAIFLVTLLTSAMIEFQSGDDIFVSNYEGVQVEGDRVIIPEGKVIHGDLTIENAIVDVRGQINGNLTLVNSELSQATPNISGEIVEVNRFIRWAAMKFTRGVADFFQQFTYE